MLKPTLSALAVASALFSLNANAAEVSSPNETTADLQTQCLALKNSQIYDVNIHTAEWVEEGGLPSDKNAALSGAAESNIKVAAHCLVRGEMEKRTGVNDKEYAINFELRLPSNWNKKFLFQGGGGTNGVVSPAVGGIPSRGSSALPALARGYAVVSNDSGHTGARDASFAEDQQARLNYAYASTGKVTPVAKQLIEKLYGSRPNKSYFMGCSNGGREAMQAAMRYPLEFDGVVAGNPGFRLSRAAVAEAWDNKHFMQHAPTNTNGDKIVANALTQADLDVVVKGVLKQCDAKDGLADGIINAWEQCDFTPEMVEQEIGKDKVALLNAIFNGAKNSQGKNVYSSWPYDAGLNTMGWRMWKHGTSKTAQPNSINFTMGVASLAQYFMTPFNPDFDTLNFDFDADTAKTEQIAGIHNADSTDLGTFKARGGKMIVFEGVSDPVFSAHDLRDWYNKLNQDMNGADDFARVFMIPGMNHCGGGPATEDFDPLTALEQWTDEGKAPDFMLAKAGKEYTNPQKEMPLCPYPQIATYIGGDENKATSYECK